MQYVTVCECRLCIIFMGTVNCTVFPQHKPQPTSRLASDFSVTSPLGSDTYFYRVLSETEALFWIEKNERKHFSSVNSPQLMLLPCQFSSCKQLPNTNQRDNSAAFKTLANFHSTGWLMGICLVAHYNSHTTG